MGGCYEAVDGWGEMEDPRWVSFLSFSFFFHLAR